MFTFHLFRSTYTVDMHNPWVITGLMLVWLALLLWILSYIVGDGRHRREDESESEGEESDAEVIDGEEVETYVPDPAWFGRRRELSAGPTAIIAEVDHAELLTDDDFIGADETWEPRQELISTEVVAHDPRTWNDERYLDVLHAVLDTPTMTWTVVDQEEDDWAVAWRELDDKLELRRREIGDFIAGQGWPVDMPRLMRDIDERDYTLHQLALEAALEFTTGERELVAVG